MIFTTPIHEANDCHNPAGPGGGQFCGDGLPPEPGSTPVPAGMIRAYHYTDNLDAVRAGGLDVSKARGSTYGEPNGIWASTAKPKDVKNYVEMFVKPSEVGLGGPDLFQKDRVQPELDEFNKGDHDFILNLQQVPPSRFVTVHEPWHDHARYILDEYPIDDPKRVAEGVDMLRPLLENPAFGGSAEKQAVQWWFDQARKRGTLK